MSFSAVLLAGGASRRMGRDKATLAWSEATLLAHQARTLQLAGAQQCLLSRQREQTWQLAGFTTVTDSEVGAGPAAALADVWRETNAQVLVALAVDLPWMPADYLRELALGAMQQERSVVPVISGRYEPLAAAWHRSCLPQFIGSAGHSIQGICAMLVQMNLLTPREVSDGEGRLFENLNTPEDYERLRGHLNSSS